MPTGRFNFNYGKPQLLPEEIERMKAEVPNKVDTALGYNDTLMPQPPQPQNVDTRSAGQRFRDQYIKNRYGGIENLPLR